MENYIKGTIMIFCFSLAGLVLGTGTFVDGDVGARWQFVSSGILFSFSCLLAIQCIFIFLEAIRKALKNLRISVYFVNEPQQEDIELGAQQVAEELT